MGERQWLSGSGEPETVISKKIYFTTCKIPLVMLIYYMLQTVHADIAQLVEQRTCNAQVIGSIPIVGSNLYFNLPLYIRGFCLSVC